MDPRQTDDSMRPGEVADPPQRMSRQQLLTLVSVASINFSSMICYSILGPLFPNEAVKKGTSQTVIGLIFGCCSICKLVGSLIMGRYIVEIGAKFMLVLGLFVSSGCTIVFGQLTRAPEGAAFITLCFVVRAIDAVAVAAITTSIFAIIAKVFPNNMVSVLGSLEIFTGLGLILGPPAGGWFYRAFDFEVPFMLLGCFLMVLVPVNIYLLPRIDADPSKDSFFRLLTKVKIVLMCFTVFILSAGLGFLDSMLSLFAIETFGLSADYVGLVMLASPLLYCLASPLMGYFSQKYPAKRVWLMMMGSFATAIGFCLLGPAPFLHIPSRLWLLILMLALIGFSVGITSIPMFPEILSCVHELGYHEGLGTLGMVSGLFWASWSLGMFCGPVVGGLVTQHLSFRWAAAVQGGLAFLAAVLLAACNVCQRSPQQHIPEDGLKKEKQIKPL